MAQVKFTSALTRFFPDLDEMEIGGDTINEVLQKTNDRVPGIINYLLEEDGSLRKHVNIFLKNNQITDREHLSDHVQSDDEILIYQALSGG